MHKCMEVVHTRLINEVVMIADAHSHPTRAVQHGDVHVPKPNIESYRQSFRYLTAILWNGLP